MIEITKIIFKETMFQVFLSNEEIVYIPFELYSAYKLEKGKVIDTLEYQQLKEESERFTCFQKALSYLAIRNRSSREIEQYLRKKGFSGYIIQETIAKLKENSYLSDFDYAVEYIKGRKAQKTVGEQYIKSKLYQRGVSRKTINKALKAADADQVDIESLCDLARKKYQQVKHKPQPVRKVQMFLAGRGFNWNTIHKVIDILKEEFEFSKDNDFYPE